MLYGTLTLKSTPCSPAWRMRFGPRRSGSQTAAGIGSLRSALSGSLSDPKQSFWTPWQTELRNGSKDAGVSAVDSVQDVAQLRCYSASRPSDPQHITYPEQWGLWEHGVASRDCPWN
jgi:hypothetical protein